MSTSRTKLCCLIGDPVDHSFSPPMFSAAFDKLGLDFAYLAFRVKREDLQTAVEGLRVLGAAGCNVTIPHKIEIIRYLDILDNTARDSGTVNVISNVEGRLVGHNTDGAGALASLEINGVGLDNRTVLIIGYGGAARAVAFELANKRRPRQILIMGRDQSKTSALVKALEGLVPASAASAEGAEKADVIINATPVGMHPHTGETPLPSAYIPKGSVVLDLVYNPLETRLLKESREKGCFAIGGLEMLVQQGGMAFKIWTGRDAPLNAMREAAKEAAR